MSFWKSRELLDGVTAEFVVADFIEGSSLVIEKILNLGPTCVDTSIVYPLDPRPWDVAVTPICCDTDQPLRQDEVGIEVKQAAKQSHWSTFFAEITQLRSKTYAEYLINIPDWMVYVDSNAKYIYFYDGNEFVAGVKSNYNSRFPNRFKTADGIKFGCEDVNFGFKMKLPCRQNYRNVRKFKQAEIKQRLLASKGVRVQGHKKCSGLPDLI